MKPYLLLLLAASFKTIASPSIPRSFSSEFQSQPVPAFNVDAIPTGPFDPTNFEAVQHFPLGPDSSSDSSHLGTDGVVASWADNSFQVTDQVQSPSSFDSQLAQYTPSPDQKGPVPISPEVPRTGRRFMCCEQEGDEISCTHMRDAKTVVEINGRSNHPCQANIYDCPTVLETSVQTDCLLKESHENALATKLELMIGGVGLAKFLYCLSRLDSLGQCLWPGGSINYYR